MAGPPAEAGAEGRDLPRRVAGRRREEQDAGLAHARERQDELIQRRVAGLHREAAAAHREDPPALERHRHAGAGSRTGAPRYATSSARSTTSPPTGSTRNARAAGRELTTRSSRVPRKCSAAPSSAA